MNLPLTSALLGTILLICTSSASLAGGIVASCDEPSLRAALAGGGLVTFGSSGTVTLTSTLVITNDTIIDGAGQAVTISGNDAVKVFEVKPGVHFTLLSLTVTKGRANQGGGVYNNGGSVTVSNCVFNENMALGNDGTNASGTASASSGMPGSGGALYSIGSLVLLDSTFHANKAAGGRGGSLSPTGTIPLPTTGDGAAGMGGALYALGDVALTNCVFTENSAEGGEGGSVAGEFDTIYGGSGAEGAGGAVYITGYLNAAGSDFSRNTSVGGKAGHAIKLGRSAGASSGGSVYCSLSTNFFRNCSFDGNSATGGLNGNVKGANYRGAGRGGAICAVASTLSIASSGMTSNSVTGSPAFGGGVCLNGGTMTLSIASVIGNSVWADRGSTYYDSNGSPGCGGGVYSDGVALVIDSLLATNSTYGGKARSTLGYLPVAAGGASSGAGLYSIGSVAMNRCTLAGNIAVGGLSDSTDWQPPGGTAYGAGVYCASNTAWLVNCTLVGNRAQGGGVLETGYGIGGNAFGGGLYNFVSAAALTNCTQAGNEAIGGIGYYSAHLGYRNGRGLGGNLAVETGTVQVANCILSAGVTNNAYGTITDWGHNLSSDASCAFSGPGSMNVTDPKLAALAENGGPTPTMALMPDSPAINAAATLADVNVDQRGVARPYGPAPDIGAFEWNNTSFYNTFSVSLTRSNGYWALPIAGPPNENLRLQKSTNLTDWSDISTNQSGANGRIVIEDHTSAGPAGFYRVVSP